MPILEDYKLISVTKDLDNKLIINNPTKFALIGQGSQGAIFKLESGKCIKVYENELIAKKERSAYIATIGSPIMPVLYEIGYKYMIIEYIEGPNLKEYLQQKGKITKEITQQLINMFYEMKRLKFLRKDESLRHILIKKDNKIKIVDHVFAFSLKNPIPIKLFTQLKKMQVLEMFIQHGFELAPELFKEFENKMPEFF